MAAIGIALVAGAAFLWLQPRVDPDAAARYAVVEAVAIEEARHFLEESGFPTENLTAKAKFVRKTPLLRSLQAAIGRNETVRVVMGPAGARWPVYAWEVKWEQKQQDEETVEGGFDVSLTTTGQVFAFRNRNPVGLFGRRDSLALDAALRAGRNADGTVLAAEPLADGPARQDPGKSAPGMAGSLTGSAVAQGDRSDVDGPRRSRPSSLRQPFPIPEVGVVAMGRYHLARTGMNGEDLTVDSVEVSPDRRGLYSVRMVSPGYTYGHRREVDVEVTGMGMLVNLQPRFTPETPESDRAWWGQVDGLRLLPLVGNALVILLLAIGFFRRLGARTVDMSAASRDAIALGLAGAVGLLLVSHGNVEMETDEAWLQWLIAGIGALFGGLGMGVIAFLISGATDAMGREFFLQRVRSLTLLRQTYFLTQPLGLALVRGVALGLALAAGWGILCYLTPWLHMAHGEGIYAQSVALSPFVASFSMSSWTGFLQLAGVLIGLGSLLLRRKMPLPGVAVVMVVALTLLGMNPVDVKPDLAGLGSGAVLASALVFAFLRFDFLTALLGFAVFHASWRSGLFWIDAAGAPATDGYVAATVLGGILLVGFIALRGSRAGDNLPEYVPEYISEMARQERVNRELEIARNVQKTFLPREMPHVRGLDMAALCIPAYEVGGDYYDFVPLSGRRLALVVGDVSGKGIQAAFYMTLAKGFFRTLCREATSPAFALQRMNRLFWENSERGTFISLIYGILDLDRCTFVFGRAGHNPVILKRSPSQVPELIRPAGLALGLVPDSRFDDSIQECTLDVRTGDVLVFHTDGFTEARNGNSDLYGESRLAELVATVGSSSAEEILRRITDDVLAFAGPVGQADDMTMVVLKIVQSGIGGEARPDDQPKTE